jgi:EspG family
VCSWTLSTVDMDFLVEALSLPPLPYPLGAPSPGIPFDERRRLVESVRADLADRGLSPEGTLGEALVLLAFGEFVIDGRLTVGRDIDLVGAVRGDRAALAVRSGDTVQVDLVPDSALTDLIVDLLPELTQLRRTSATVPHEALVSALTTISRTGDFREYERILASAEFGAEAQFGVAVRTPATDAYRDRRVWIWYASESGGVLLGHDPDDSLKWTTLAPAAPARVGQCLSESLFGLRHD